MSGTQKTQLTVEQIKKDLVDGLNRKAIAKKYGISVSATNKLFLHPELANLRPKGNSNIELVDSTGQTFTPAALAATKPVKVKAEATETEANAEAAAEQSAQVSENSGI